MQYAGAKVAKAAALARPAQSLEQCPVRVVVLAELLPHPVRPCKYMIVARSGT